MLSEDPAWPIWAVTAKDMGRPGPWDTGRPDPWDGPAQLPAWPPTKGQTSDSLVTPPPVPHCFLLKAPGPPSLSDLAPQEQGRRAAPAAALSSHVERECRAERGGGGACGAVGSSAELGDSMAAGRPEERKLRRAGRGLLRKLHVAGGQSRGARGPGPPQPGPSPHVPELCLCSTTGPHTSCSGKFHLHPLPGRKAWTSTNGAKFESPPRAPFGRPSKVLRKSGGSGFLTPLSRDPTTLRG